MNGEDHHETLHKIHRRRALLTAALFLFKSNAFARPGWGGTLWYRDCVNGKVDYRNWPVINCYAKAKKNTFGPLLWSARCNGNGIIFYTNKSKATGGVRCVTFPYKKGITMIINEITYKFDPATKKLVLYKGTN